MEKNYENMASAKYSQHMTAVVKDEHMLADGIGAYAGSIGPVNYFVDVELNMEDIFASKFIVKLGLFGVDIIDIELDAENPKAAIDLSVSGVGVEGEIGVNFDECRIYCTLEIDYLIGSKTYTFDIYHWGNHNTDMKICIPETNGLRAGLNGENAQTAANIMTLAEALNGPMGGNIMVRNEGAYIAKFSVTYEVNGAENKADSGTFTCGVSKDIGIPKDATNICVRIKNEWFPGQWSTIKVLTYEKPDTKSFVIGGTTLNPTFKDLEE